MNPKRLAVFAVLAMSVLVLGCLSSQTTEVKPQPVKLSPCNVANIGIQIRIKAEKLDPTASALIQPELEVAFVDNFKSQAAAEMRKTYKLSCYWGNKVGQRRDYFYCDGTYKAPDLDENQVIRRFINKQFSIGFSVEEHNVGTWTDSTGKVHNEGSVFYLTTKTVDASCYLAA